MDPQSKKLLREAGGISAVGLEMGISVAIGFLGGRWLDGKFGTAPTLQILGIFFGLGAAFMAVLKVYKKARRLGSPEPGKTSEKAGDDRPR
ncbi:AtpZ/AtpI family protein [bacterium]|nr:AtpZ/AtpI family protein [bacterium]